MLLHCLPDPALGFTVKHPVPEVVVVLDLFYKLRPLVVFKRRRKRRNVGQASPPVRLFVFRSRQLVGWLTISRCLFWLNIKGFVTGFPVAVVTGFPVTVREGISRRGVSERGFPATVTAAGISAPVRLAQMASATASSHESGSIAEIIFVMFLRSSGRGALFVFADTRRVWRSS